MRNAFQLCLPMAASSISSGAIHARPAMPIFGNEAAHNSPAMMARRWRLCTSERNLFNRGSLPESFLNASGCLLAPKAICVHKRLDSQDLRTNILPPYMNTISFGVLPSQAPRWIQVCFASILFCLLLLAVLPARANVYATHIQVKGVNGNGDTAPGGF